MSVICDRCKWCKARGCNNHEDQTGLYIPPPRLPAPLDVTLTGPCQRKDPMSGGSCGRDEDDENHYPRNRRGHDFEWRDRRIADRRAATLDAARTDSLAVHVHGGEVCQIISKSIEPDAARAGSTTLDVERLAHALYEDDDHSLGPVESYRPEAVRIAAEYAALQADTGTPGANPERHPFTGAPLCCCLGGRARCEHHRETTGTPGANPE